MILRVSPSPRCSLKAIKNYVDQLVLHKLKSVEVSRKPLPVAKAELSVILAVASAFSSAPAASDTWTASTSGNWSTASNWSDGVPSIDGTAGIFFGDSTGPAITSTINSSWWGDPANPAPVSGFTFGTASTTSTSNTRAVTISLGTGVNSLSIGADGITSHYFNTVTLPLSGATSLYLSADQVWNVINSVAIVNIGASLRGAGILSKTGSGSLGLTAGNGSAWTGHLLLEAGSIQLYGAGSGANGTIAQLGANAMTWNQGAAVQINLLTANTTYAFATPIMFSALSANNYRLTSFTSATNTESVVDLQGALSGTIGVSGGNGLIMNATGLGKQVTFRLSGNNSGLASTVALGDGTAPFAVQYGNLMVANANSLGSGNSLGVSLGFGPNGKNTPGYTAGLYAENSLTVQSNIYSSDNFFSGSPVTLDNYIGISGTGTAAFTGAVTLARSSSTPNARASNAHLTASSGGTAIFSGLVADGGGGIYNAPLIVDGGGKVELTNSTGNTYAGGTTVSGGSTLVLKNTSNSATGTGSIFVGANSHSGLTGITVTAATGAVGANGYYVTGIDITGLRIGQTVTSAGAGVSGTIVAINPNGNSNTIQISALPSTAGTFSDFSFGSLQGTLGGAGIVKPGTANSVEIANGSYVYPGAEDMSSVGTLILDGGSTTAALLTMDSGAAFKFNLGTSGASDLIKFYNYSTGDLVLNDNAIHLNLEAGAGAGTYKLLEFYGNAGTTLTASGIASGLTVDDSSLGEFSATLIYGSSSISVKLNAVPEPSAFFLLGLGGVALLGIVRRKSAPPDWRYAAKIG